MKKPKPWAVALALGLCVIASVGAQRAPRKHHRKPRGRASTALRHKLADVQTKKRDVKRQIRETTHQADVVTSDIQAVDARLDHLERRLDVTTAELEQDRGRQKQLAVDLEAAQQKLTADTEAVRKRLRSSYMEGDSPLLSAVIGSVSSGDLASKAYLVDRIAKADHEALLNYRSSRDQVSRQKAEADALVIRISGLVDTQKSQARDLQDTRREKRDALAALQEKKDGLNELLDQVEDDEASIERQIAAATVVRPGAPRPSPGTFGGRLGRPVDGPITSTFGMRFHPILHITRLHAGIDFGVGTGTPIRAAASGVVVNALYMKGLGNVVFINHGGGVVTVYAHCSRLLVSAGDSVTRGQHIANSGATGLATGPHLHFEVRIDGKPVNPLGWIGG